jgi:hypothetical protein
MNLFASILIDRHGDGKESGLLSSIVDNVHEAEAENPVICSTHSNV